MMNAERVSDGIRLSAAQAGVLGISRNASSIFGVRVPKWKSKSGFFGSGSHVVAIQVSMDYLGVPSTTESVCNSSHTMNTRAYSCPQKLLPFRRAFFFWLASLPYRRRLPMMIRHPQSASKML